MGGRDRAWKATVVTETDPREVWQWCRVSEFGEKATVRMGVDMVGEDLGQDERIHLREDVTTWRGRAAGASDPVLVRLTKASS